MAGLWSTLLPLAIASAIVPVQLVVTVVLQRSAAGRVVSLAWVLGMLTVRLGQGIVIGLLIGPEVLGGTRVVRAPGPRCSCSWSPSCCW